MKICAKCFQECVDDSNGFSDCCEGELIDTFSMLLWEQLDLVIDDESQYGDDCGTYFHDGQPAKKIVEFLKKKSKVIDNGDGIVTHIFDWTE